MKVTFRGRAVVPGAIRGEALVSRAGFNAYAIFYDSLRAGAAAAVCADKSNEELYGKNLTDKILCLPGTIGSTSAGAVWLRVAALGVAPQAVLFSQQVDSLAAGGLIVADVWGGHRIATIDGLGDAFLALVESGDRIETEEDGTVVVERQSATSAGRSPNAGPAAPSSR